MGGFAEMLGGAFKSAGEWSTSKLRGSEIGGQILDTFRSQRVEFMRGTPQGTLINSMLDKYTQTRNQMLDPLLKPVAAVKDAIKDNPNLMSQRLSDLHQSLQNTNHPAQIHTAQLMQDPMNHAKNLVEINERLRNKASLGAKAAVFGVKSENLAPILMSLYDSPDPVMHSHAEAMLNIMANVFHDTTEFDLHGQGGGSFSRTKLDIRSAIELENKQRAASGMNPVSYDTKKMDVTGVYQHRNDLERLAARRARMFLAPLIVIPHISTFFNLSWAPLTAIGKTMMGWSDHEVNQVVEASGIYNNLIHHMLDEDLRNSTGFIASKTAPVYGRVAGNLLHNPGFNALRKVQLHTAGILGYHSTMYWAGEAVNGDKRAMRELQELGLNVRDIIRRGGELTPDEKRDAVFQFVNNRVFVDRLLDRSLTATRNPWTRMLTMFHGYVSNQQIFMRRELQKMFDSGDYTGIARFAGTVGLVFPAVAPLIASAEVLGRTASPQAAGQELQDKYHELRHPEKLSNYLDLLSYFGTWGTLHSFFQSAGNDRLALQLMGPIAGSGVRTTQDMLNYMFPRTKSGKRNIKPIAEDVLQQSVPIAGNIAAHRLFPSRKKKGE